MFQYPGQADHNWQQLQHQQNHAQHLQHSHQPHSLQTQQAQAQAQAAAAAAAAAQQQHYSRLAANNQNSIANNNGPSPALGGQAGHNGSNSAGGPDSANSLPSAGGQQPTSAGSGGGSAGSGGQGFTVGPDQLNMMSPEERRVLEWIAQLMNPQTRESALLDLSKKREQFPQLALILWHSFGVMTSLLQEIISVYPLLNPSQLTAAASNRVCNALALLQCVAAHNETRSLFLSAHIPLFLYPFLNTTSKSRPFEYLRLTSLGVIGALVKNDSTSVINFLLTTEIIPLCLRIMETGSELSKTVAIFIVQKILLDDTGLNYICQTYERFYAVGTVLSNMVNSLVEQQQTQQTGPAGLGHGGGAASSAQGPTVRLLKHVVRCFLRLSDNARAREALRQCLPEPLRDGTFMVVLRDDAATKRCLAQLLINLADGVEGQGSAAGATGAMAGNMAAAHAMMQ